MTNWTNTLKWNSNRRLRTCQNSQWYFHCYLNWYLHSIFSQFLAFSLIFCCFLNKTFIKMFITWILRAMFKSTMVMSSMTSQTSKILFHLWWIFQIWCQIAVALSILKFSKLTKFWDRANFFVIHVTGSWMCYLDSQSNALHFWLLLDGLAQILTKLQLFKILTYF